MVIGLFVSVENRFYELLTMIGNKTGFANLFTKNCFDQKRIGRGTSIQDIFKWLLLHFIKFISE
jgi:hypothetical protein